MIIENDCREILQDRRLVDDIRGKTFLITGSNGLIGNYFATLLDIANREFDAQIMACCISKNPPKWENDKFDFITLDLAKHIFIPCSPVDYIIHAATYTRPRIFLTQEWETIALNTIATRDLLGLAENGTKFLYFSSSEIYGDATQIPTPETYTGTFSTDHPRGAYVEAKRMGEVLCFIHNRQFGGAKVARLSSVYGPGIGIEDERAMGDFMRQAFAGCIQLLDRGQVQRTYCYITDAIKMLLDILLRGKDIVYNVGGIETCSLYHLAKLIADEFGADCLMGDGEGLKGAPNMVKLDISKIQSEFGVKPFVSLIEGLRKTIQWNCDILEGRRKYAIK